MKHASVVELAGAGWRSGPLLVARSCRQRRRGLRPRPRGLGLLLEARSVHGCGMQVPLGVASLDAGGRVRRVGMVCPGRLFWDLRARWVVEVPAGRGLPPVGTLLSARAGPFFPGP